MGRHVASFVIGVDGEVTSEALTEFEGVITHHVGIVASQVQSILRFNRITEILVTVNVSSQLRDFGDHIKCIFQSWFPVLGLVDTAGVGFGELGVGL